jgi:hypothetical protein
VNKPQLGRLQRVSVRDYWVDEAREFTPWLAQEENVALLGEAIGLDLEVEAQEKNVGPFRADILCKHTLTDHLVLIENQLERTDHTHLGQLMTYAAGLDAVTVVWVSSQFTDEHRAALDWLNRITDQGFNFFGLEVELWRIDDSPMAPKFNVVAQPNDWSKNIKQSAQAAQRLPATSTQELYLEFWTQFRDYMQEKKSQIRLQRPGPHFGTRIALGKTYLFLVAWNIARDKKSGVYLAIQVPDAKEYFRQVRDQYGALIDRELGPVRWNEQPDKKGCDIGTSRDSDVSDRDTWPNLNRWFEETIEKWDAVFRPILQAVAPAPSMTSVSAADQLGADTGPAFGDGLPWEGGDYDPESHSDGPEPIH